MPEHDPGSTQELAAESIPVFDDTGDSGPPTPRQLLRFLLPSLVGVLIFLTPIHIDGNWTILMGVVVDLINKSAEAYLPAFVVFLLATSAIGAVYVTAFRPGWAQPGSLAARLFMVSPIWVIMRILGFVMGSMTVFEVGPEFFWHASTGGVVMYDLATKILGIFLIAGFAMPFLTDYGLMEFAGRMLKHLFRILFRLPGRAAVDALASWLASAPVGVLITIQQYQRGYYSKRESAIIATNFSVVSVPFALIVAKTAHLGHMFLQYYGTVVIAGLTCAIILPRIAPLSLISADYKDGVEPHREAPDQPGVSLLRQSLRMATARAAGAPPLSAQFVTGIGHILDIWLGLLPAVIVVGGAGLILAEFTPVMGWLSAPLVPVIELFGLPEAAKAAPAFISGFMDMFLPALMVANIDAEITRFVVAVMSVTQLIYMSEVGILLLKCEIPLKFWHLLTVFLLRTAISFPVAVLVARTLIY